MKLKGMGEEDRFFLYFALQAMRRARLPFVEFVSRPEEAMQLAEARFKSKADVLVFPHGGITYPDLG